MTHKERESLCCNDSDTVVSVCVCESSVFVRGVSEKWREGKGGFMRRERRVIGGKEKRGPLSKVPHEWLSFLNHIMGVV